MKKLIWLIILIVVGVVGVLSYWNSQKSPADPNNKDAQAFVVQKGEAISSIADRLVKAKIIRSSFAFRQELKLTGKGGQIEAGDFKLSPSMSLDEIITNLQNGSLDKWVTLLEGWRVEQMAGQLSLELGVKSDEFIKVAKPNEGHLFPDTYLLNKDATPDTIVSTLKNTFEQKYNPDLKTKIKGLGLTEEQGIILASVVEREARSDQVRTNVASILLKRLKMGMALNADATVQYAKDSQTFAKNGKVDKFWQPVTQEEYQSVVSTYNTYLHSGLPPAPVCNPSVSSLKAVANADPKTPYLYYYHDSKGNSYYAKTLEEHTANVANHK